MAIRNGSPHVGRRQFLRVSGTAVVGFAVANASTRSAYAAPPSISPLLGIGYAAALPAAGRSVSLGDANSILTPDPSFISRDSKIAVVGAARATDHPADSGVALDAYFPIIGRNPVSYPRFGFWSAYGDSLSGLIRFRMPVLATTGLNFVARRLVPTTGTTTGVPSLSSENTPASIVLGATGPKLQRGVYVFAFKENNNDNITAWSRLSVVNQGGTYTVSGVSLTYLVMSIDYFR